MKKIFALIGMVAFSLSIFAGEPINKNSNLVLSPGDGEKCFDEKTHIINLGIGLASGYYVRVGGEKYSSSPYLNLSYEQPWPKKLGPGFLGVGAYFGYKTEKYEYNYNTFYGNGYRYEKRHSYYTIAGRAAYHWDVLNSKKAEVYGGVLIGAHLNVYSYSDNDPNNDYSVSVNPFSPYVAGFVGARYYFGNNFGVFAEIGVHPHSHSSYNASVGFSIKF